MPSAAGATRSARIMKPNWFIALPVSAGSWYERLTPPPRGFRAFHRADLHATVAFLGAVDEGAALRAFDAIDLALGPIEVTLGAVVAMGPAARYSALSALLEAGRAEVERAIGACRERAWTAAGAAHESRPPKAHVTLARPDRRASERDRRAGLAWADALCIEPSAITIDRVALYTWSEDRADRGAPMFRVAREAALVAQRAASD